MKKAILILILLSVAAGCTRTTGYRTPFETGGETYQLALLPWKSSSMSFDFKYRWTMTQALEDACRQSGAFKFDWSAYPVNGGNAELLEVKENHEIWKRGEYGKYYPDVEAVRSAAGNTGADLAALYVVSADNSAATADDSMNYKDDYVRLFLVDLNTGNITTEFIRTDFLRKRAFGDIKRVTLRAFNKWLMENK